MSQGSFEAPGEGFDGIGDGVGITRSGTKTLGGGDEAMGGPPRTITPGGGSLLGTGMSAIKEPVNEMPR